MADVSKDKIVYDVYKDNTKSVKNIQMKSFLPEYDLVRVISSG